MKEKEVAGKFVDANCIIWQSFVKIGARISENANSEKNTGIK